MKAIDLRETDAIEMKGGVPVWHDVPDKLEEGHGLLISTPIFYEGIDGVWKAAQKKERAKITKRGTDYYVNSNKIGNINNLNSFLKRAFLRPL